MRNERPLNEREAAAVLWAVEHFRHYVWGRRFEIVTDCSALIWLFKSQNLSPKLRRWALRLMEYDMELEWREGSKHYLPDALSRLPRLDGPENDIDVSFPGESPTALTSRGPQGPVLDGIPLKDMGVEEIKYRDKETGSTPKCPVALAAFVNTEVGMVNFAEMILGVWLTRFMSGKNT